MGVWLGLALPAIIQYFNSAQYVLSYKDFEDEVESGK